MRRTAVIAAATAVALALAFLVPALGLPSYYVSLLSQSWIFGITAMSLDLLVGFTGLVSFAQAAFFGLGAYTVAILATHYHVVAFGPATLAALLLTLAVAAAFALLMLRGQGTSFIIITLALNEIVWGLAYQWVNMSGGDNGITGFNRPQIGPFNASSSTAFYYVALVALLVCVALLLAVVRSPFGLTLVGVRERPRRMAALGYNVWLIRYAAILISALLTGLAGVLFAYYNEFVGTSNVNLATSTEILIMVILGGKGTLLGPLLGSAVVVFVSNALSNITQRWQTLLGALYVIILVWAPDGVIGLARRAWEALGRRPGRPAAAEAVAGPPPEEALAANAGERGVQR
jgi:branched-chain amino acid transport system permease protein